MYPSTQADNFTTLVSSTVLHQIHQQNTGEINSNVRVRNIVYAFDRHANLGLEFTGSVGEANVTVVHTISDTTKIAGTLRFAAGVPGGDGFWGVREVGSPSFQVTYDHSGRGNPTPTHIIDVTLDPLKEYEIVQTVLAQEIIDYTTDGFPEDRGFGAETFETGLKIEFNFDLDPVQVPEPTTSALALAALCLVVGRRRVR